MSWDVVLSVFLAAIWSTSTHAHNPKFFLLFFGLFFVWCDADVYNWRTIKCHRLLCPLSMQYVIRSMDRLVDGLRVMPDTMLAIAGEHILFVMNTRRRVVLNVEAQVCGKFIRQIERESGDGMNRFFFSLLICRNSNLNGSRAHDMTTKLFGAGCWLQLQIAVKPMEKFYFCRRFMRCGAQFHSSKRHAHPIEGDEFVRRFNVLRKSYFHLFGVAHIDRCMMEKDATNNNNEMWHAIAVAVLLKQLGK